MATMLTMIGLSREPKKKMIIICRGAVGLHIEISAFFLRWFLFRRIQANAAAIEYAKNPLS